MRQIHLYPNIGNECFIDGDALAIYSLDDVAVCLDHQFHAYKKLEAIRWLFENVYPNSGVELDGKRNE